ncbi:MAG: DUF4397 domain-containing protein [Anaerolineales bacterium]|nr:DUF4397 domain-containing protein [Anaerolineales bacterium]
MKKLFATLIAFAIALSSFGATAASGHRDASVYVIHGIRGEDLGADPALPVDVSVNGACALKNFKFGEIVGPLSLPAGSYSIAISLADGGAGCTNPPVIGPADIRFRPGENATVIAHLTESGAPTASKFTNRVRGLNERNARLVVRHTAAAPTVDIGVNRGDREIRCLKHLSNGGEVFTRVRAGEYSVFVYPTGAATPVAGPIPANLEGDKVTVVYAVGTLSKGTFTVLAQVLPTH